MKPEIPIRHVDTRLISIRIVAIYALVSGLWIFTSDTLLGTLVHDPETLVELAIAKGMFFILVTTLLLYQLIRRAIRLISQRESHIRKLIEKSPVPIAITTDNSSIEYLNERFVRTFGYTLDTLPTLEAWWQLACPDPVYRQQVLSNWTAALLRAASAGDDIEPQECNLTCRDASVRVVVIFGARIGDKNLLLFNDITERKLAEADRLQLLHREQKARKDAESANLAKDQFLAILSHELRTPLTPVLAQAAFSLQSPGLSPEQRSAFQMIQRNVELEVRLISDLLDITRIVRGELELRLQLTDAHAALRAALDVYSAQIASKHIDISLDLHADACHVMADPVRLQQIFWNLIGNAVKYTPSAGRIQILSATPRPGTLAVSISDSGVGIDPDFMPKLFQPFVQGEQTLSRRFGGQGLGLSISKALVEKHGGSITARSDGRDRGATFTVEFPTAASQPAPTPAPPPPPAPSKKSTARILLVEDNEDTLRILARLLRSDGHHIHTASTLQDALAVARDNPFDLLISDIGLPDGTGWELIQQLRPNRSFQAIAISGFVSPEDTQKSRDAGFAHHFAKPLAPQLFLDKIHQLLP